MNETIKLQPDTTYITRNRGLVHTGIHGFGSGTIPARLEVDKRVTIDYHRATGRVCGVGMSDGYDIVAIFERGTK